MNAFIRTKPLDFSEVPKVFDALKASDLQETSIHATFPVDTKGAIRERDLADKKLKIITFDASVRYPPVSVGTALLTVSGMLREQDAGNVSISLMPREVFEASGYFPYLLFGRLDGQITVMFSPSRKNSETESVHEFQQFIDLWSLTCEMIHTSRGFLGRSTGARCEIALSEAKREEQRDAIDLIRVRFSDQEIESILALIERWMQEVWFNEVGATVEIESARPRNGRCMAALHAIAVARLPGIENGQFSYLLESESYELALHSINSMRWKIPKIAVASFALGLNDYANVSLLKEKSKYRISIEVSSDEAASIVKRAMRSF